jgi:hypothetical protein
MNDENSLAAAWIRFQSLSKGSVEYDQLFWVVERFIDASSEPATAWNVIQKIISLNQNDAILAMVGAGPFEDLMVHHGALLIDKVESCARASPAFRRMLGVVWKNAISDEVWDRIRAIAPPSW